MIGWHSGTRVVCSVSQLEDLHLRNVALWTFNGAAPLHGDAARQWWMGDRVMLNLVIKEEEQFGEKDKEVQERWTPRHRRKYLRLVRSARDQATAKLSEKGDADHAIPDLEIPNGTALVYDLEADLNPEVHPTDDQREPSWFLSDGRVRVRGCQCLTSAAREHQARAQGDPQACSTRRP